MVNGMFWGSHGALMPSLEKDLAAVVPFSTGVNRRCRFLAGQTAW
jgi:hypothetical protein